MSTDSDQDNPDLMNQREAKEEEDANCSVDSSADLGSGHDSSWDISRMAKEIEAELDEDDEGVKKDGTLTKGRTRNPSLGSSSSNSRSSSSDSSRRRRRRRRSSSSSSSSRGGQSESEEDALDRLTKTAIAEEVSEMLSKKRAFVKDLDSEDDDEEDQDEEEENSKDNKGGIKKAAAASEDEGINLTETEGSSCRMSPSSSTSLLDHTTGEEKYCEGFLVWAKLKGYSYWPGVVTVDPVDAVTTKLIDAKGQLKKPSVRIHVHFIGYENQRAWVPESACLEFRGRQAYDKMAAEAKGPRRKEFYPTKKFEARFEKAVRQAEDVLPLSYPQRLQELGYVYVPVAPKPPDFRTAAEKKLIPSSTVASPTSAPEAAGLSTKSPRKRSISGRHPSPPKKLKSERSSSISSREDPTSTNETFDKSNGSDDKGIFSATTSPRKRKPRRRRPSKRPPAVKESPAKTVERRSSAGGVVRVSSPEQAEEIRDINGDDDEFASEDEEEDEDGSVVQNGNRFEPRLGSLVWGRMAGFPFWPCFITKAPDGEFVRRSAKLVNYHVQFFNWNNESGWVGKVLPWCTLEEFRLRSQEAAKSKGSSHPEWKKAWCPQGKGMEQKWSLAYQEAHSTVDISRKERYHRFVVFYRSKVGFDASTYVPTEARGRKRSSEDHQNGVSDVVVVGNGESVKKRRGRKPKKSVPLSDRAISVSEMDLPPGWSMQEGEFISPEGVSYPNFRELVRHLFQQNVGSGPLVRRRRSYSYSGENDFSSSPGWLLEATDRVRYAVREPAASAAGVLNGRITTVLDDSLPANWMVKKVLGKENAMAEMLYYSPKEDCLTSKFDVANYMETKGHPSNELEQLLSAVASATEEAAAAASASDTTRTTPCSNTRPLPSNRVKPKPKRKQEGKRSKLFSINLSKNTAEEFLHHPILGKAVMACNWSVEIVQLPDVFLKHPSVYVKESANEMVISCRQSGEFLAKKIIYD